MKIAQLRGLLIDVQGVLTIGRAPVPGAGAALEWLRQRGIPFRVVTNITQQSRAEIAAALSRLGIALQPAEIYTASALAAAYLRRQGAPRTWVLLKGSAYEDFAGLELTDHEPQYIVLGDLGDDFNAEMMNRIYRALLAGAQLVAPQRNAAWIAPEGPRLDVGSWIAALEYATGQPALIAGKPAPLAYELPLADMGIAPHEAGMVSDAPDDDLAGARAAGLKTIFTRTNGLPRRRPVADDEFDYTIDSIADLPALLG